MICNPIKYPQNKVLEMLDGSYKEGILTSFQCVTETFVLIENKPHQIIILLFVSPLSMEAASESSNESPEIIMLFPTYKNYFFLLADTVEVFSYSQKFEKTSPCISYEQNQIQHKK